MCIDWLFQQMLLSFDNNFDVLQEKAIRWQVQGLCCCFDFCEDASVPFLQLRCFRRGWNFSQLFLPNGQGTKDCSRSPQVWFFGKGHHLHFNSRQQMHWIQRNGRIRYCHPSQYFAHGESGNQVESRELFFNVFAWSTPQGHWGMFSNFPWSFPIFS